MSIETRNAVMKHIVIYRPHGKLIMETKYYGPFES